MTRAIRAAVVGHVEWVQFAVVDHVPAAGEIVHSTASWELPAGGGAAAAGQLARLAGSATLYTALGDDELATRVVPELANLGIEVRTTFRRTNTRRAFTHVDAMGERTITVIGERSEPRHSDPLGWDELGAIDAVYFTAGDTDALLAARSARVLVGTSRILDTFKGSGVQLDALVGSAADDSESYREGDLEPPPLLSVRTDGASGGTFRELGGPVERYPAAPLPGPVADRYGAGDSFAAALTFGLAAGMTARAAIDLAARCAASVLTGRGPYEGQPTLEDLGRAHGRA
jgi:ribokinase